METKKELLKEEIIDRAINFKMQHILDRYVKDYDLPMHIAKEHERELKRYLAACAINPKAKYGMRGPVDELWHTFIMFTKDYFEFSNLIAGAYLHHTPVVPGEIQTAESKNSYSKFLYDYKELFKETPPSHLWPKAMNSEDCTGCGPCSQGCSGNCRPQCD